MERRLLSRENMNVRPSSRHSLLYPLIRASASVGPWKKLAARRGLVLKNWPHTVSPLTPNNPYGVELAIDTLLPLITSKTRLIAYTACSNILGTIVDVENVVKAIRAEAKKHGARKVEVCIDCVAYAPHRRIDVRAWDVEYAYFSYYKVL